MEHLGIFKDNADESIKCVYKDKNGIIEMTLLQNRPDTDVVCVPTHYFCNLGCKMCHLTNNALNKKSVPISIEPFLYALTHTTCNQKTLVRRTTKPKLLISFMGVGEPTLNYNLIIDVFRKLEHIKVALEYDEIGFAFASMLPNKQLYTIVDMFNRYSIPIKLHFSLHSPLDKTRSELIPYSNNSVEDCFHMLDYYNKTLRVNPTIMSEFQKCHSTTDLVEIHYTLIDGVNDTKEDLDTLCEFLSKYGFTIKFIKFNPKDSLQISQKEQQWVEHIKNTCNVRVKQYTPPGKHIGSSCGEFTKHYYHEEIETEEQYNAFLEWKNTYQITD